MAWASCRSLFVRLVRGLRVGGGGGCALRRGVRTGSGLVRPLRRAALQASVHRLRQGCSRWWPCGQVQDQVPVAVAGGPGGHGDQVAADGGGARPGVAGPGAGSGGAQQVVRHGGEDEPGPVCGEMTGWQVGEGPGVQVGDDLLDDRVAPVLAFCLQYFERGVGEDGMVAVGGEQLALPLGGLAVAGADAADDQPCGDLVAFLLRRERGVPGLGDLGVGDPAFQLLIPDGLRVADRGPGVFGDAPRSRPGRWGSPGR